MYLLRMKKESKGTEKKGTPAGGLTGRQTNRLKQTGRDRTDERTTRKEAEEVRQTAHSDTPRRLTPRQSVKSVRGLPTVRMYF